MFTKHIKNCWKYKLYKNNYILTSSAYEDYWSWLTYTSKKINISTVERNNTGGYPKELHFVSIFCSAVNDVNSTIAINDSIYSTCIFIGLHCLLNTWMPTDQISKAVCTKKIMSDKGTQGNHTCNKSTIHRGSEIRNTMGDFSTCMNN